ncbi:MAG: GNAT family N-acetyltransferase [Bryobacteraceae bacterium]
MTPVIRSATFNDGPALVKIELQSFADPSWDLPSFFKYTCFVAEVHGTIAAFLVSREVSPALDGALPQREILNLAVAPGYRGTGLATALLKHELSLQATHFLEVRESNLAAQALYRKCGFVVTGRRRGYYEYPPEAAIVMTVKKC